MSIIVISILTILAWTSLFKQTFTTKEGFKYVYEPISKILYTLDFKLAFMDLSFMVIFLYFAKQD
jgi:uncharacterized protein YggT (Ycf19 family)